MQVALTWLCALLTVALVSVGPADTVVGNEKVVVLRIVIVAPVGENWDGLAPVIVAVCVVPTAPKPCGLDVVTTVVVLLVVTVQPVDDVGFMFDVPLIPVAA